MRVLGSLTLVAIAAVVPRVGISAQETGPRFDVASVKPNAGNRSNL